MPAGIFALAYLHGKHWKVLLQCLRWYSYCGIGSYLQCSNGNYFNYTFMDSIPSGAVVNSISFGQLNNSFVGCDSNLTNVNFYILGYLNGNNIGGYYYGSYTGYDFVCNGLNGSCTALYLPEMDIDEQSYYNYGAENTLSLLVSTPMRVLVSVPQIPFQVMFTEQPSN